MRSSSKKTLRPRQLEAANLICDMEAVFLALPMAWGKTATVLRAIRRLLDELAVRKVLIVGPLRVVEHTWPDEIREWDFSRVLSYSVLTGPPEQRARRARLDTEIHLINRENVRWLVEFWGDNWPYDMLVWDEASRLKAGKKRTRRTKSSADGDTKKKKFKSGNLTEFGSICQARKYIDRVVELSGTPAPNGLIDLWGPIYLLDGGERLGRSKTAFQNRWFNSDYMGWNLTPKEHAHDEIMDAISDIMISFDDPDAKKIPVQKSDVVVHFDDKLMAEYKRFARTLVAEKYDVEALSRGVLANKLLQFANGSMYREDRSVVHVHDLKLDALDSIIAEAAGENILVGYSFKFDLARIKKRFPKAVIFDDEPDFVKKWNQGKIGLGLIHPASGGHGLNLQFGGRILAWYGLNWSSELYDQLCMRLPRTGQDKTVFIYHILAHGTYDYIQKRSLIDKDSNQREILKATLRHLKEMAA